MPGRRVAVGLRSARGTGQISRIPSRGSLAIHQDARAARRKPHTSGASAAGQSDASSAGLVILSATRPHPGQLRRRSRRLRQRHFRSAARGARGCSRSRRPKLDQRDQPESPTAAWARQDVEAERPLHQRRPRPVAADLQTSDNAGRQRPPRAQQSLSSARRPCRGNAGRPPRPRPRCPRAEHAKVQDQVDARPRYHTAKRSRRATGVNIRSVVPSGHGCRSERRTRPSSVSWRRSIATGGRSM